jgi:hypothetical protein
MSTHFPVRLASSAMPGIPEDFQFDTVQERFGVPRHPLQP